MAAKIYQDSQNREFATQAEAAASNTALGTNPATPMTINSSILQGSPTPIKIPPTQPSTGTDGALAYLGAQSTQYANQLAEQAKIAQQPLNDLSSQITSLLQEPGQTALTGQAYEKTGVNTAETELKDINNQILAEQHALDRQVQALEKNPSGLFGGGLEQEIQKVKNASLARQADLSILQMAKQGRFDSAKQIADRAVAALTEARQNKLNALQFLYSENKDIFTKAEQRSFEVAQKQREDELGFERQKLLGQYNATIDRENFAYQQKLKQADPEYQLDLKYKRAQIDKIYSDMDAKDNADATGTYNVATLTNPAAPTIVKNSAVLTDIFKNNKVSAGNKTSIGNGLSLLKAAQDLADANPEGKFPGFYPARAVIDWMLPQAFKREKTVTNESLISALNLQTQFWASGAALSDPQTALVQKMIPTKNDTDKAVRAKANQLVNYMLSQTSSRLSTDGISFTPEKVDLFETATLLRTASPEQLAELRAAGLIQ